MPSRARRQQADRFALAHGETCAAHDGPRLEAFHQTGGGKLVLWIGRDAPARRRFGLQPADGRGGPGRFSLGIMPVHIRRN
jgi:hypothetical protein